MSKLNITIQHDNGSYTHNPGAEKLRSRWSLCERDNLNALALVRGFNIYDEPDEEKVSFVRTEAGREP